MALPIRQSVVEQGWPLGEWSNGADELEPDGSAGGITGLLGDDSLPYRRGGTSYWGTNGIGTGGLEWVADGYLAGGRRSIAASVDGVSYVGAQGAALTSLLTGAGTLFNGPVRVAVVAGVLLWPATTTFGVTAWAGSVRAGAAGTYYTNATATNATVTEGSATVTGTLFTTNVQAGDLLTVAGTTLPVRSVESATSLTTQSPWPGGNATATYTITTMIRPATSSMLNTARYITSAANRLVGAVNDRVYFSNIGTALRSFATDFHSFPAEVSGLGSLRNAVMVFTSAGVFAISNMGYDLVDAAGNPQQRVDLVNGDILLWGHNGIVNSGGALIVPAKDNIYLFDGVSAPVPLGDPIKDLYLSYVQAGYNPGVAEVHAGHYLLPILDSGNTWVDTLVCRLRPLRGSERAWSRLAGFGAQVKSFANRTENSKVVLLGGSSNSGSRVLECTSYFKPTASVKNDADATTHTFRFTTRNIKVGDRLTAVRHMRAKYALVDAASDNPTITAEASVDGGSYTTLTVTTGTGGTTTAGEQDGTEWVYWTVSLAAQNIRFRFTCSNPAASLTFKQLEFFYRPRGN